MNLPSTFLAQAPTMLCCPDSRVLSPLFPRLGFSFTTLPFLRGVQSLCIMSSVEVCLNFHDLLFLRIFGTNATDVIWGLRHFFPFYLFNILSIPVCSHGFPWNQQALLHYCHLFSCSSYPQFGQVQCLYASSRVPLVHPCHLSTSCFLTQWELRLILSFLHPSLGYHQFSKESGFV